MPWRLNQASGFRQQGKYNRTSAAERSEIRREAVRPLPLQDAPTCPGLAHPGFHSKSSFVCFPAPSYQPMKNHRVIPEEPEKEWRIICPLQQSIARQVNRPGGSEPLKRYFLSFEPRWLRSVIFGMRMEAGVKQRLCDMLGQEEFKH